MTKWTTWRGTPLTQSYSAHPAKRTDGSRSGTHVVCDPLPYFSSVFYAWHLFFFSGTRKQTSATMHAQGFSGPNQLCPRRQISTIRLLRKPALLHVLREGIRRFHCSRAMVPHGPLSGTPRFLLFLSLPCLTQPTADGIGSNVQPHGR